MWALELPHPHSVAWTVYTATTAPSQIKCGVVWEAEVKPIQRCCATLQLSTVLYSIQYSEVTCWGRNTTFAFCNNTYINNNQTATTTVRSDRTTATTTYNYKQQLLATVNQPPRATQPNYLPTLLPTLRACVPACLPTSSVRVPACIPPLEKNNKNNYNKI